MTNMNSTQVNKYDRQKQSRNILTNEGPSIMAVTGWMDLFASQNLTQRCFFLHQDQDTEQSFIIISFVYAKMFLLTSSWDMKPIIVINCLGNSQDVRRRFLTLWTFILHVSYFLHNIISQDLPIVFPNHPRSPQNVSKSPQCVPRSSQSVPR